MLKKINTFLKYKEINHFITTKEGGVSTGKYKGLNLALHTGDNDEKVLKNRQILAGNIGRNTKNFIYLNQVHGSDVFVAKNNDKGRGAFAVDDNLNYDSVITNEKGLVLMILVADCVPIIIYDSVKEVIGVIHSGWKGTKDDILGKTIKKCIQIYGSNPKDILVGIGPCISKGNYEVGEDVALNFDSDFYLKKDNNKFNLDLQSFVKNQALNNGILKNNLEIVDKCSFDNKELFFSARRDGIDSGRFGLGIYLL